MAALAITIQRPVRFDEPIMARVSPAKKPCRDCGIDCRIEPDAGVVCAQRRRRIGEAAAIVAAALGQARPVFSIVDDKRCLQIGVWAWDAESADLCVVKAIRHVRTMARHCVNEVQASARACRSNSTAQKEYDRLQDIVSRSIEALGLELQYA